VKLYALHDSNQYVKSAVGSTPVTEEEAVALNADGWGIFWVVNEFKGRRLIRNLTRIRYWFCEIDGGTKDEQYAKLSCLTDATPTMVVESKNGYHVYWKVRGEATVENWKRIVRWGIVPALGADPKATDPLRLLRAPNHMHMKDIEAPFAVRRVWTSDYSYTEEEMLRLFPSRKPETTQRMNLKRKPSATSSNFWERVAALDNRRAIPALSGHWLCNEEQFYLREMSNGNANIIRHTWVGDGHSKSEDTGSFIDEEGRLGNVKGGTSVAAWCAWYGHDWPTVRRGLLEVFPELEFSGEEEQQEQEA
jgi:hypothetical protein